MWRLLCVLTVVLGCGGVGSTTTTTGCVPGQSIACVCDDGASGGQRCLDTRTYGACVCSGQDGGVVTDSGSRPDPTCTRRCTGRACGDDGCGGTCGTCAGGTACSAAGQCECVRQCTGRMCGDDGCGGTCGVCQRGFVCNSAGTDCGIDQAAQWVITVTNGTVSTSAPGGGAWDVAGGAPDPYVCITLNGSQTCTPFVTDSFAPRWNFTMPATTGRALLSGVTVSISDDDIAADDVICSAASVAIPAANFVSGGGNIGCTSGSFNYTLTAR